MRSTVSCFKANGVCNELILFHDASLTFELSSYISRWEISAPFSLEMENDHKNWAERRAKEWLDRAGRFGIQGKSYIDSHYGDIADEVLTAAKAQGSGLVVMASQRGPFASVILGSQARTVVRASEIPVWLYGVHFCELTEVAERSDVPGVSPASYGIVQRILERDLRRRDLEIDQDAPKRIQHVKRNLRTEPEESRTHRSDCRDPFLIRGPGYSSPVFLRFNGNQKRSQESIRRQSHPMSLERRSALHPPVSH